MTTPWTTEAKGIGEYAEVNGINLLYETRGTGRPAGPAARRARIGRDVRADPPRAGGAPPVMLLDGRLRDGGWMSEKRPKRGRALAVPPGPTHYGSFASPLFAAFALDFLDGPQRETAS